VAASTGDLTSLLVARWRTPEGPLSVIFFGYPLWWLLGAVQPVVLAVCVAMLVRLLRDRTIVLPRGIGWWALFVAWVVAGVLVLQIDVPGAVPGASGTRYLTWAVRVLWFLEAGVVLLYVVRRQISPQRVVRLLGWMFVTIVVGGVLGTLVPTLKLIGGLEFVLPASLLDQPFIASLVHPTLAERQVYLDVVRYRPSAPFPYSNAWGLNYLCFLPFFVVGWLGHGASRRRRLVAAAVLACSVIPVVYSGNRGLWVALAVLIALVVVKQATAGQLRPLLWTAVGGVVAAVVVVNSPLYGALVARLTGHTSNAGRANLALMTAEAVAHSSPVMGAGTTRTVQGSFYSIAGGSTPSCPLCTPPALGTQGFFWLMLFGTGFVGAALGLVFWLRPLRHLRRRSPIALASIAVLIAFVLTLPIYDWSITAGFAAMTAIALLERDVGPPRLVRVASPVRLGARLSPVAVGCVIVGTLGGVALAAHQGPTYVARAKLYLPADPHAIGTTRLESLDNEARWVHSPSVLASTAAARARDRRAGRGQVVVDATANTRILGISYSSRSRAGAGNVTAALADAFLADRAARLDADRTALVAAAQREIAGGVQGAVTVQRTTARLRRPDVLDTAIPLAALADEDLRLRIDTSAVDRDLSSLASLDYLRGREVGPVVVRAHRPWNVDVGSGLLLGLLAAAALRHRGRRPGQQPHPEEGRRG
jgi:hypothetical protein